MRRVSIFTLPLLLLGLTGCADQATAPDVDLISLGKKPPKPPPDPVTPANPVIAFDAGNHRKRGGLWVADVDGGNAEQIYNIGGGAYFRPSWSPKGAGTAADPYEILYRVPWSIGKVRVFIDAAGKPARLGDPVTLSTNVNYVRIAVSPNGDQVVAVWAPIDGSSPNSRLVLTNPETFSPEDDIYTSGPNHTIWAPTWSPDGEKIAFLENEGLPGATTLKILDLSTLGVADVFGFTNSTNSSYNMSWARTSDRLVFDYDGEMYSLELEENDYGDLVAAGEAVPLGPGYGPVWSPNDTKIVYDTRTGVYIKTLDGTQEDLSIGGQWFSDWRRNPIH